MLPVPESKRLIPGAKTEFSVRSCPMGQLVQFETLPSAAAGKRPGVAPMPPTKLRGEPRLRFRHALPV